MTILPEDTIFETEHLILSRAVKPHIPREDGGHIRILTKRDIPERRFMTPQESVECAWLTDIAGEALENAMHRQGIEIVKINYQDNGNWVYFDEEPHPRFHVHLYARRWGSKDQPFPEALHFPNRDDDYYKRCTRMTDQDMVVIAEEIDKLARTEKYANKAKWHL